MSRPSISVVITNFDGEGYIPDMMEALRRTQWPFLEIIVSDDNSQDGSRLLLRHHYPEVVLITSDRNRGPAPARNEGIRAARGDLVLLLDNDGFPFPDSIEPLVARLESNPELVGVMPRVILHGSPPTVHCDGARTHVTGHMWLVNGHSPLEGASEKSEPLSSLMGTAMIFRRDAALAIDGFSPDFFIYYEDHDFGTRLRTSCGTLVSAPTARIDHRGGTPGLSFRHGRTYPPRRAYLTARNRTLFMLRNLEGRTFLVLWPIFFVHDLAQFLFVVGRGWIEPWFNGLRWNITHLGRTLRHREVIQAARRTPDRELLQSGPIPLHPGAVENRGAPAILRRTLETVVDALYRLLRPLLG